MRLLRWFFATAPIPASELRMLTADLVAIVSSGKARLREIFSAANGLFAFATIVAGSSASAQDAPTIVQVPLVSFGEVVSLNLSPSLATHKSLILVGPKRISTAVVEFPLAAKDIAYIVLETDARITITQLKYKEGKRQFDTIPNWEQFNMPNCKGGSWKLQPGRYVCWMGGGWKNENEAGLSRLMIDAVDAPYTATVKLAIFRAIEPRAGGLTGQWAALLADGTEVASAELLDVLEEPARSIDPAEVALANEIFIPRAKRAAKVIEAPSPAAQSFSSTYDPRLRPYLEALYDGGEHNAVLNFEKLGLAAIEVGDNELAKASFDAALSRIESVFADDPAAVAARSHWENEAVKDFKGEAYERVMAYYYRGLLYLAENDFENASASFRAGEYQDTMAQSVDKRSDFAVLPYLAGWAERCAGKSDRAQELFEAAEPFGFVKPADDADTVVIAEHGGAPIKQVFGLKGQDLAFAIPFSTDPSIVPNLRTVHGDSEMTANTDLFLQAATRGERGIDSVIKGKVRFGTVRRDVGGFVVGQATIVALSAIPLAGIFAATIGGTAIDRHFSKVGARSDTRVWDTLPYKISATAIRNDKQASPTVEFNGVDAAISVQAGNSVCRLSWFRDRSIIAQGAGVAGEQPDWPAVRSENPAFARKDEAFRAQLFKTSFGTHAN